MNLKDKRTQVTLFLILVIIIVTCFVSIKILTLIKENIEFENILTENISKTQWPAEVPIIKTMNFEVTKVADESWVVNVNEYISYEALRDYLIELYSEGFQPLNEFGSYNPKLLSINEPTGENAFLSWIGKNENYTVEVFWDNTMLYLYSDSELDVNGFDQFTILLYSNDANDSDDMQFSGDNTLDVSGDALENVTFEISGDESGDVIFETSGDESGDLVFEELSDNSGDSDIVSGD